MAYQSFDSGAEREDDHIAVSYDGVRWFGHPIWTNTPSWNDGIFGVGKSYSIASNRTGLGFWSGPDPDILITSSNWLWYINPLSGTYSNSIPTNFYPELTTLLSGQTNKNYGFCWAWRSTNGVNWDNPKVIAPVLDAYKGSPYETMLSPSLVEEQSGNITLFFQNKGPTNTHLGLGMSGYRAMQSDYTMTNWTQPWECKFYVTPSGAVFGTNVQFWHFDVCRVDSKYYMLAMGAPVGGYTTMTAPALYVGYGLHWFESTDRTNWYTQSRYSALPYIATNLYDFCVATNPMDYYRSTMLPRTGNGTNALVWDLYLNTHPVVGANGIWATNEPYLPQESMRVILRKGVTMPELGATFYNSRTNWIELPIAQCVSIHAAPTLMTNNTSHGYNQWALHYPAAVNSTLQWHLPGSAFKDAERNMTIEIELFDWTPLNETNQIQFVIWHSNSFFGPILIQDIIGTGTTNNLTIRQFYSESVYTTSNSFHLARAQRGTTLMLRRENPGRYVPCLIRGVRLAPNTPAY